ncbi:MAG: mechanosensitive ion channel domain-containing protein [Phycisphaerales bacterium]
MPKLEEILDTNSLTLFELVLAAVILIVAGFIARFLRRRIQGYLEQVDDLAEGLPKLLGRVTGWAVILVGVVLALTVLGFDTGGIVLLLALIAVVVVVAGKGIIENFAAGLLLQIHGPFRVGDRIEAKDYVGVVQEINARTVVIETGDRRTVHVPNKEVLDDPIVNFTTRPERRSEVGVGVAYDADVGVALMLVIEAAASVEGVYADPPPRAFIEEFGDSSVDLTVQFWHDDGQRVVVRGRVAEGVKAALDDAGIDIPFPQRVVALLPDSA